MEPWLGLPKHLFFLFLLLILALILFLLKNHFFKKVQAISPTDIRNTVAFDDHECWATVEVEVDNFLMSQKIPHKKPEKAQPGEYFTNSAGVPNFVVYKSWEFREIHSIIEIRGMIRPKKKFTPVLHNPDVKPVYAYLNFEMEELMDNSWKSRAYKFYKELREEIKQWAEHQEKILLK